MRELWHGVDARKRLASSGLQKGLGTSAMNTDVLARSAGLLVSFCTAFALEELESLGEPTV